MTTYENQCAGCGLPCLFEGCRHYRVPVLICDGCGEEKDALYEFDGGELCLDCVAKRLTRVDPSPSEKWL